MGTALHTCLIESNFPTGKKEYLKSLEEENEPLKQSKTNKGEICICKLKKVVTGIVLSNFTKMIILMHRFSFFIQ